LYVVFGNNLSVMCLICSCRLWAVEVWG